MPWFKVNLRQVRETSAEFEADNEEDAKEYADRLARGDEKQAWETVDWEYMDLEEVDEP